jgi:hypothetical protein
LLGKQHGMFGEKLEITVPPEQAKARILELLGGAAKRPSWSVTGSSCDLRS